jgi:hypothetical protein
MGGRGLAVRQKVTGPSAILKKGKRENGFALAKKTKMTI